MAGKIFGLILAFLALQYAHCGDPPVMKGSYIAWGEIVQPVSGTDDLIVLQLSFEESYDADAQNSAFFMWMSGKNVTFVKNHKLNQTFLYVATDKKEMECKETSEQEWVVSDIAPGLLAFEDDDGTVKFSLSQLLNIPNKYLMDDQPQGASTTYRGIPAKSWMHEIRSKKQDDDAFDITLVITSFWSDDKWNTSAGQRVAPLGFNISKITWSDPVLTEDYVINVFGFVPDAYDHKFFEPYQGIVCAARKSTLKFPSVRNIRAISLHSEIALPNEQELRYIDTWLDPLNQLVRIDVERFLGEDPVERVKHYQSEVAIGKLGIVYRLSYYKGEADCKIIPFDKYQNDFTNIFDVKQNLARWQMGKIFGLNDTSYVYIGKTTKNDIPCHLFQGIRTDWPDKSAKIQSLWEWCFNVNMTNENDIVMFQENEFGLISANIIVLSDPKNIWTNYRINHHFYDVKAQDPKLLDATSFDIGRCFKDTEKRLLQFYLNVAIGEDNKVLAENATSDINFLQKWKTAIYKFSGLPQYSLRVSGVKATVEDDKLYIKFALLSVHKDFPKDSEDESVLIPAFDAETNLRKNINDGKVYVLHAWDKGKVENLTAVKHSVTFQINPKFQPRVLPTLPPTTPGSTTPFVFTIRTVPPKGKTTATPTRTTNSDSGQSRSTEASTESSYSTPDDSKTTPSGDNQVRIVEQAGHGPGSVAGVSIAVLLIGVTIGSAGTFYKFNGLPACMKRGGV